MNNQFYQPNGNQPQFQFNNKDQPPSYWAQQPGHQHPNGAHNYPPQLNQQHRPPGQQQQQQQRQHQAVVVGRPTAGLIPVRHPTVSMLPAIGLSCFAFWFCGCLFGLVAFILAMVGHSSSVAGDKSGAMQLRNASYGVSIAGIVAGLSVIAIAVGVSTSVSRGYYRSSSAQYNSYYNSYYYNNNYNYYSLYINLLPTYYRAYYSGAARPRG